MVKMRKKKLVVRLKGLDMAFGSVYFGRREGLVWC